MKFAINAPNSGVFGNPRWLAELASESENAGWDGFFLWDHILAEDAAPVADTWVLLAAMTMTTQRIRLGPMITPLPRRQPWKLAREAVTLDRLSNGRLVLGVGLGDDSIREYSAFNQPAGDRVHAEMLDEGLQVLAGLWSGEPFSFEGRHYQIRNARFLPRPVQQPRIPIWVAGRWPSKPPFRRAALWDGVAPIGSHGALTPEQCRDLVAFIQTQRTSDAAFDVAVTGWGSADGWEPDAASLASFARAGVTWYQVAFSPDDSPEQVRQRVRRGPPKQ